MNRHREILLSNGEVVIVDFDVYPRVSGYSCATVSVNRFAIRSYRYADEATAALAYNQFARAIFREYARLNDVIDDGRVDAISDFKALCQERKSYLRALAIVEGGT